MAAVVQSSGSGASRVAGAGSLVLSAFGSSVTVDNYIVVGITTWVSGTPNVVSVADTFGNSYTEEPDDIVGGNAHVSYWWTKITTGGASNVVTVTTSASSYTVARATEVSGIASASAVDLSTTTGADDSSSPFTLTSSAKAQDEEIVFVCMGTSGIANPANFQDPPTTGYTRIGVEQDAATYTAHMSAYKLVNVAGTESVSMTFSTSPVRGVILSLKAAAGGAEAPVGNMIFVLP